ncbi:integral membrane protein 2C-like [Branchiostoma lanceolatum]|uniref:integral membrane protein 2C-like n=1 Tax=Branchiostoma lanceolatum TaxID=7740 RepID=UPI003452FAEF
MGKITLANPSGQKDPIKDVKIPMKPADDDDVETATVAVTQPMPRRRNGCTSCIMALICMLLVIGGIAGGLFLYRHFGRHRKFVGRCGVRYNSHYYNRGQDPTTPRAQWAMLEEDVEVDLDGEYERIEVPDFDKCNHATVLHDFRRQLTAFKDWDHMRCFVMALNESAVPPPRSLFDLLMRVKDGSFMPQAYVNREVMRVVQPPIADTAQLGQYIHAVCRGVDTYRLTSIRKNDEDLRPEGHYLAKRDISEEKCDSKIRFYSGKEVSEVCIQFVE